MTEPACRSSKATLRLHAVGRNGPAIRRRRQGRPDVDRFRVARNNPSRAEQAAFLEPGGSRALAGRVWGSIRSLTRGAAPVRSTLLFRRVFVGCRKSWRRQRGGPSAGHQGCRHLRSGGRKVESEPWESRHSLPRRSGGHRGAGGDPGFISSRARSFRSGRCRP